MFRVPMLSLAAVASLAACQVQTSSNTESLAAKCAIDTLDIATTTPPVPTPTPDPVSPADCPVCKDADGKPLPADACEVHDDVCHVDSSSTTGGVYPTRQLQVVERAE